MGLTASLSVVDLYRPIRTALLDFEPGARPERESDDWEHELTSELVGVLQQRNIELVDEKPDLYVEVSIHRPDGPGREIDVTRPSHEASACPYFLAEIAPVAEPYFSTKGWDHSEAPARLYNGTIDLPAISCIPWDLRRFLDDYEMASGRTETPEFDAALKNLKLAWGEFVRENPQHASGNLGDAIDELILAYEELSDERSTPANKQIMRRLARGLMGVVREVLTKAAADALADPLADALERLAEVVG